MGTGPDVGGATRRACGDLADGRGPRGGAAARRQGTVLEAAPARTDLVGFFIAAGAIGGLIFNASRGSEGEITKSGDLAAEELRVGDCFDLKDPSAQELDNVTALPCSSEHEYETFHVGTVAEGPFPTEDAFIDWIDANCVPAFNTYVGLAYEESELEITWLQPTSEAWNDGDRSMQCVLYHPRIHRLTESMKDSAQ